MPNIKEWKTKFNELPLLLRIVVAWVYLISIVYFLKFFFVLIIQVGLAPFDLAFGYLIWVLAGGLVNRINLARIIALVCFVLITAILIYVVWNGGVILLDSLTLTFLYPGLIFWVITSTSTVMILLLPQVRKLFSNSTQEEKKSMTILHAFLLGIIHRVTSITRMDR